MKTLGIDAMNIRDGGGLTHLREIIANVDDANLLFDKVIVWGNEYCLKELPNKPWLIKINPLYDKTSVLRTTLWQIFSLGHAARKMNCSMLFIAGGSAITRFHPKVTICHNMLPFTDTALNLYHPGFRKLKFYILRFIQIYTFRNVSGMIFLSEWAKDNLLPKIGKSHHKYAIIPHGVNNRFNLSSRIHRRINDCSFNKPFTLLYVSRIESYKNQLQVVEAFNKLLLQTQWPLRLELVGPVSDKKYEKKLKKRIATYDPNGEFIYYLGSVPYEKISTYYWKADLGIFASSCENMPIILIEKMVSGLPIICNDAPPMHDFLDDAGVYVNFKNIDEVVRLLRELIENSSIRNDFSNKSVQRSGNYTWIKTSQKTFEFLYNVFHLEKMTGSDSGIS